jgi:hypothetical protein
MDKPLSQERLSEEIIGMIEYDLEEGHQISWGHAKFMFDEVKRLQSIEARYKATLKTIAMESSCDGAGKTLTNINIIVNKALGLYDSEGVNDHEA